MAETPIEKAPVTAVNLASGDHFQAALSSLVSDTAFRTSVASNPSALTAKFSGLKAGEIAVLAQISATSSKFADGDINCCCCCCA